MKMIVNCNLIQGIYLSRNLKTDALVWNDSPTVNFTVRSAHWLARSMHGFSSGDSQIGLCLITRGSLFGRLWLLPRIGRFGGGP